MYDNYERCDQLQDRFDIVGVDNFSIHENEAVCQECLRPQGQAGPHLIRRLPRIGGEYVTWENALCDYEECDCRYWEEDGDITDVCITYGVASEETAKKLIEDESLI